MPGVTFPHRACWPTSSMSMHSEWLPDRKAQIAKPSLLSGRRASAATATPDTANAAATSAATSAAAAADANANAAATATFAATATSAAATAIAAATTTTSSATASAYVNVKFPVPKEWCYWCVPKYIQFLFTFSLYAKYIVNAFNSSAVFGIVEVILYHRYLTNTTGKK